MRKLILLSLCLLLVNTTAMGVTQFTVFKDIGYSGVDVDWSGTGSLVAIKTSGNVTYLIKDVLGTPQLWQSISTNCGSGRGAVVFSPDSSMLFTSGEGNPEEMAVLTLNYPSSTPVLNYNRSDHGKIEYRACDWAGSRILVGRTNDPECELYYTSLSTERSFDRTNDCMAVAFDKTDPTRFVTGDKDGYIKANGINGQKLWQHHTDDMSQVQSVAWYGSNVIVGDRYEGAVYRYGSSGGRLGKWTHGSGLVTCAEFSPDGQWLATCCGGSIKIWNTNTWTEDYVGPSATCVAWDPTTTYLVDNNGKLYAPFCDPPVITQSPQDRTVYEDDPVTFNVLVSGTTPFSYQWRKNNVDIQGESNQSYTINHVSLGDAGSYDCVVTNTCGSVTSNSATLMVTLPPILTLLSPNGGEKFIAGQTETISWDSSDDINNVKIEFSDSNGFRWDGIDANTENDGSYNWLVPEVTSQNCLLRISDINDANIYDTSDDVFTIFQCQGPIPGDLNKDCYVDFLDFAIFAEHWLHTGNPLDSASGIVAYWSFDEGTGSTVYDYSGNGIDGDIHDGVTRIEGVSGKALAFNGTDGYVDFGDTVGDFGTNDFSVVFWMRTDTDRWETVMGKRVFCGEHSFFELQMSLPTFPGRIRVELYEAYPNIQCSFYSNQRLDDNQWHLLTITRKDIEGRLYIDGFLDASRSAAEVINISNSAPFLMGNGPCYYVPPVHSEFFSGELDEVCIYNRALTAAEVEYLYNAQ